MSTIYCACGAKNEFQGIRPKTCFDCGESFEKSFAPPKQERKASRVKKSRYEADEDNDNEDSGESLSFDAGSIKIEKPQMLTVAALRESSGGIERQAPNKDMESIRSEVLGKLLKN